MSLYINVICNYVQHNAAIMKNNNYCNDYAHE